LAYIFGANSLFGPTIGAPSPLGQSIVASDLWSGQGDGFSLGTGVTVALGEVFFDLTPGAPVGPITVSFDPSATSLSDVSGNPIAIDTQDSGTVSLTPEPSSLALFGLGSAALLLSRARRSGRH
jgi:hypothetical protein